MCGSMDQSCIIHSCADDVVIACVIAGCCSSLVALNVSRNALPALPDTMSRLAKLQVLAADSNRCVRSCVVRSASQ